MEDSSIDDTLDDVLAAFARRPTAVEDGLDVDGSALLQLRKACRLLEAAQHLDEENGYYTVVIEASFGAKERTLQFYLLENQFLDPDEYVDHREVYERSHDAGLYDEGFRDKLVDLWRDNRSRSYYREGVGSANRAEKVLALADQIHGHVLQLAGKRHDCVCENA